MEDINTENTNKSLYGIYSLDLTYLTNNLYPFPGLTNINIGSSSNLFNKIYSNTFQGLTINANNGSIPTLTSNNITTSNITCNNFTLNGSFANSSITCTLNVGSIATNFTGRLTRIGNLIIFEANLPSVLNNTGSTINSVTIPYNSNLPAPAINTVAYVQLNNGVNNLVAAVVSVNGSGYFNFMYNGGNISLNNGNTLVFTSALKLIYTV